LTLIFPSRPDITAAAWAILAFGDGAATLVGRGASRSAAETAQSNVHSRVSPSSTIKHGRLPWNADKSIAGTAAFIVCGSTGAVALAWWTRSAMALPPLAFTLIAPVAATLAAAFVETIPVRLDDNI